MKRSHGDDLRKMLLRVARWLNKDDQDLVDGGCREVSVILQEVARRLGHGERVRVVSGMAGWNGESFPHAWNEVDGVLLDATSEVRCLQIEAHVEGPQGQVVLAGPCVDDPQSLNDQVGRILAALRLRPVAPPLAEEPPHANPGDEDRDEARASSGAGPSGFWVYVDRHATDPAHITDIDPSLVQFGHDLVADDLRLADVVPGGSWKAAELVVERSGVTVVHPDSVRSTTRFEIDDFGGSPGKIFRIYARALIHQDLVVAPWRESSSSIRRVDISVARVGSGRTTRRTLTVTSTPQTPQKDSLRLVVETTPVTVKALPRKWERPNPGDEDRDEARASSAGLVPVTKITLSRAEGPVDETGTEVVHSFMEAHAVLRGWGRTAPGPDGGHHKTDFKIEFADGEDYQGRFDLVRGGKDDAGDNLREHVLGFLRMLTGEARPPEWMTAPDKKRQLAAWTEAGRQREADGSAAAARAFCARYDLRETTPNPGDEDRDEARASSLPREPESTDRAVRTAIQAMLLTKDKDYLSFDLKVRDKAGIAHDFVVGISLHRTRPGSPQHDDDSAWVVVRRTISGDSSSLAVKTHVSSTITATHPQALQERLITSSWSDMGVQTPIRRVVAREILAAFQTLKEAGFWSVRPARNPGDEDRDEARGAYAPDKLTLLLDIGPGLPHCTKRTSAFAAEAIEEAKKWVSGVSGVKKVSDVECGLGHVHDWAWLAVRGDATRNPGDEDRDEARASAVSAPQDLFMVSRRKHDPRLPPRSRVFAKKNMEATALVVEPDGVTVVHPDRSITRHKISEFGDAPGEIFSVVAKSLNLDLRVTEGDGGGFWTITKEATVSVKRANNSANWTLTVETKAHLCVVDAEPVTITAASPQQPNPGDEDRDEARASSSRSCACGPDGPCKLHGPVDPEVVETFGVVRPRGFLNRLRVEVPHGTFILDVDEEDEDAVVPRVGDTILVRYHPDDQFARQVRENPGDEDRDEARAASVSGRRIELLIRPKDTSGVLPLLPSPNDVVSSVVDAKIAPEGLIVDERLYAWKRGEDEPAVYLRALPGDELALLAGGSELFTAKLLKVGPSITGFFVSQRRVGSDKSWGANVAWVSFGGEVRWTRGPGEGTYDTAARVFADSATIVARPAKPQSNPGDEDRDEARASSEARRLTMEHYVDLNEVNRRQRLTSEVRLELRGTDRVVTAHMRKTKAESGWVEVDGLEMTDLPFILKAAEGEELVVRVGDEEAFAVAAVKVGPMTKAGNHFVAPAEVKDWGGVSHGVRPLCVWLKDEIRWTPRTKPSAEWQDARRSSADVVTIMPRRISRNPGDEDRDEARASASGLGNAFNLYGKTRLTWRRQSLDNLAARGPTPVLGFSVREDRLVAFTLGGGRYPIGAHGHPVALRAAEGDELVATVGGIEIFAEELLEVGSTGNSGFYVCGDFDSKRTAWVSLGEVRYMTDASQDWHTSRGRSASKEIVITARTKAP